VAEISANLGPKSTLDDVTSLVVSINELFAVAEDVQSLSTFVESLVTLREYSLDPEPEDSGWAKDTALIDEHLAILGVYGRGAPPNAETDEYRRQSHVVVERMQYYNPFAITIDFPGKAIREILEVIRDWGAARRQAKTAAAEAESAFQFREALRTKMLENLNLSLTHGSAEERARAMAWSDEATRRLTEAAGNLMEHELELVVVPAAGPEETSVALA